MSNELMKVTATELIKFTPEQEKLIKSQIAPKATNDELKLFLYQAKRTGLDPLARQIYAIHRKAKQGNEWVDKMTIQTSIDGFRVIAERSGSYAGQDEPEFIEDGNKLVCCKVRVYRWNNSTRYLASVGVAYWDEYVPKEPQDAMWKKMPHTMLSKVAEALALRKAFPQDLSGLYTSDEMNQADAPNKLEDAPAQDITAELSAAISEVYAAESVAKLTELKQSLPDYIVRDASFIAAGKQRYEVLIAEKP